MPTLIIRDVPKEVHERLKRQASENHRSMGKEALAVIERLIRPQAQPRWELLDRLPKIDFSKRPGFDPVKIIRKMRDEE